MGSLDFHIAYKTLFAVRLKHSSFCTSNVVVSACNALAVHACSLSMCGNNALYGVSAKNMPTPFVIGAAAK
jgi:hypothetical protein